jgi:DNA-binding NtrC family response regulator
VRRVAPTRLAVLIEGPTGSGKELVAAAIHEESGRRGAFVPFNVCAIPESMFEDALFGHVRGAFTNAFAETQGYLREADGGTVFLDEIGALPRSLQAKLLRALETGKFRPVGAGRDVHSDFRLVAATNEPAALLVADGRLRPDLAHRIAGITIAVPALAERTADIARLVRYFATRSGSPQVCDDATLAMLIAHAWPGNVRELRNVVECAIALGGLSASIVHGLVTKGGTAEPDAISKRHRLRAVLVAHRWNTESAAKTLGVNRTTVYRWMKESRIERPPAA